MKKTVAVFIVLFVVTMGTMVVWGFIEKQAKENTSPPLPTQNNASNPSSNTQNATSQTASKTYSAAEVSKHKTKNDCWIIINSNVYDVTDYLDFHPGGADMILMVCGKDATREFSTQGGRGMPHPAKADAQLANYLIGKLE